MIAQQILPVILASWVGLAPPAPAPVGGAVTEVRIVPSGDQTEIVVVADGNVSEDHFLLSDPTRLILDVRGARHQLPRYSYEAIGRGGVVRMRSSQFRSDVVRLVFDLTRPEDFQVEKTDEGFRVTLPNPGDRFAAWSTRLDNTEGDLAMTSESPRPGPTPVKAQVDRETPASPAPPMAFSSSQQQSTQPRITVAYDSASMLDVIAGFSEFSGISIVPSAEAAKVVVRGVDIRDQPWDQALDAILSAQGLGWRRMDSGIIIVDKLEGLRTRDTLQTETRVMRINYASADSVAATLQKLATPKRGQVVSYEGTNSVIVTDVPTVVERMDSLVRVLDRRTPQVSIEAKIVFVNRTDVNNLGIVYDLKERSKANDNGSSINKITPVLGNQQLTQSGQPIGVQPGGGNPQTSGQVPAQFVDLSGGAVAALANANDRLASPALQILVSSILGDYSLFTFIDALEQHSLSDLQAAPTVTVVDNHKARIQVGEKTPIRVLEPQAQLQQATVNVEFENTGIILDVTPHITNNNQVLMDLSAENSSLEVGLADVGFTFKKQIGQTRLLVNDGETAVIGGLTSSEVTRSESGIPGLMDIPLLGNLFRTTKNDENKQDLIILVTPHIVPPEGPMGS